MHKAPRAPEAGAKARAVAELGSPGSCPGEGWGLLLPSQLHGKYFPPGAVRLVKLTSGHVFPTVKEREKSLRLALLFFFLAHLIVTNYRSRGTKDELQCLL